MKAVFIVPEYSLSSKGNNITLEKDNVWEYEARMRLWSCPSLSLLTIAGMIPKDSEIEYIDLNYTSIPKIKADCVFFSPATSQVNRAYQLADKFRDENITVVMGGPHVSVFPNEALQHSDVVFIGEAEQSFQEFLRDFQRNQAKQIYDSCEFPDLALAPLPAYHLAKQYPYKSVPVQTSRGCPHQCSFCVSSKIYGKKIRCKTANQLEKELKSIKEIYGKPYIFFTDDNLFIDKSRNNKFIGIMKSMELNWYAFSDASIADDLKLLSDIADAGCTQLLIGFESLCSENLHGLNKNHWKMKKLDSYKEIIKRIQNVGIGVVGSFVVGMENDTADVFERLYAFIEETSLYATNITVLTPFPGTQTYQKYKSEGRLMSEEWSSYNGFELTYELKQMTAEEFEEGYQSLNKRLNSSERMNKTIEHFKTLIINKKYN